MKKFDKIRRLGKDEGATFKDDEDVVIQEKIDGANFRVWTDEYGLRFGSRQIIFPHENDPTWEGYGAFTRAVDYIKENKHKIQPGYLYYFEAMIKHTIKYDFDKHPAAILFDVYDIEAGEYLPSRDIYGYLFQATPEIHCGKYGMWNQVIPESAFGKVQAEGVVIKSLEPSYDSFGNIHRAKIVTDAFKEENREVFGSANDKESAFVMKFTTTARIDKHINHLSDAMNKAPEPQWVPILTYNITKDICDEEFKRLLKIGQPNLQTIRNEVQRQVKLRLGQLGVL